MSTLLSGAEERERSSPVGAARGLADAAAAGVRPFAVEGTQHGHWVLMDFSDVIVHIFYEPVRQFYDLDGLWGHAPKVKLPESYAKLIKQLQAGETRAIP